MNLLLLLCINTYSQLVQVESQGFVQTPQTSWLRAWKFTDFHQFLMIFHGMQSHACTHARTHTNTHTHTCTHTHTNTHTHTHTQLCQLANRNSKTLDSNCIAKNSMYTMCSTKQFQYFKLSFLKISKVPFRDGFSETVTLYGF